MQYNDWTGVYTIVRTLIAGIICIAGHPYYYANTIITLNKKSKMKTILNLKKSIFFAAALTTIISFASCSDDDDDPKAPAVTDVYGSYKGKVTTLPATENRASEDEAPTGIDITATVNNDTIHFENFPVEAIVAAIEGEDAATEIVKSIEKVNLKVGYKGELNQAQDSVKMVLDPKPLEFTYKVAGKEMEVEVIISAPKDKKSAYSDKTLKFSLELSKVTVNNDPIDSYQSLYYNFDFKKQ